MNAMLRKRFQLALRQPAPDEALGLASSGAEIQFVGYAEDAILSGRTSLTADRLTDMLNEHDEYELRGVRVEPLAGGEPLEVDELVVARDELLLVQATGPRGHPGRRHRTQPTLLEIEIGAYHVSGFFHALPGADPIGALRRRRPIVPLTDAWIEAAVNRIHVRSHADTLLVNREQIDSLQRGEVAGGERLPLRDVTG